MDLCQIMCCELKPESANCRLQSCATKTYFLLMDGVAILKCVPVSPCPSSKLMKLQPVVICQRYFKHLQLACFHKQEAIVIQLAFMND